MKLKTIGIAVVGLSIINGCSHNNDQQNAHDIGVYSGQQTCIAVYNGAKSQSDAWDTGFKEAEIKYGDYDKYSHIKKEGTDDEYLLMEIVKVGRATSKQICQKELEKLPIAERTRRR